MFIQRKLYNKFGAKTEMAYGNYMVTKYMYNSLNLRLDSLAACLQANKYFSMGYRYDAKGNVNTLYSSYTCFYNDSTIKQTFVYDSTDQIKEAMGNVVNGSSMYTVSVNYNNWGKIGRYTTSINGSDTFMYPSTSPISTYFAPNTSVNNGQTTTYDFGLNGSLRRKQNDEAIEYYLFNAFNCMKAYSYNAERYGYYGYDASGERSYKMDINFLGIWTNELEEISDNWELGKMMLYPNGYMNINQSGEYTKHYYADALRIASKIGSGFSGNICDSVSQIENDYPGYLNDRMTTQNSVMMSELYETTLLASPQGSLNFINPYEDICNLGSGGQETGLYFYHPDHLGSTGMVTDNNANIAQGFLYAPFGEILSEYNTGWKNDTIPKYAFNAKELDEENGMYYYSARYYAPPTFISRDPMFEIDPTFSPYTYCGNNPIKYSDPTGKYKIDKTLREQCPRLAEYLESGNFEEYLKNNPTILEALKLYGQFKSDEEIFAALKNNSGPTVCIRDKMSCSSIGEYEDGTRNIYISSLIVDYFNNAENDDEMGIAMLWLIDILLHETVEYGDYRDGTNMDNRGCYFVDNYVHYIKGYPHTLLNEAGIYLKNPESDKGNLFEAEVYFNKQWSFYMDTYEKAKEAYFKLKKEKPENTRPSF